MLASAHEGAGRLCWPYPWRDDPVMKPIKCLRQWYRAWRTKRQALKAHDVGGHNPSQGAPPLMGHTEDARLRLLKSDPGPRII